MTSPDALDDQELLVCELLLFETPFREIGRKLGISHTTAWEISKRPKVSAYVERVRAAMGDMLQRKARAVAGEAIDTLREIMQDTKAPHGARVAAAGHALRAGVIQRHEVSGPEGAPIPVQTTHLLDDAEPKDVQELLAELRRARG